MSGNLKSINEGTGAGGESWGKPLPDIMRVPIDYILEVWEKNKLVWTMTLPNSPESLEVERPAAANMRFTLGDLPIRQVRVNKVRDIRLTGRSGIQARQGYTRKGAQTFASGKDILLGFDGFLQDYSGLMDLYVSRAPVKSETPFIESQPYMVFRALNEKVHLRVEPVSWSWRRSADTSRLSYEWQLSLKGYGYAPQGGPKSLFAPVDQYAASLGNAINLAAVAIGILDNVARNTRGDIKGIVSPALGALRNITKAMLNLSNSTNQLLSLPKSILGNFVATAAAFELATERFKETVNPFDGDIYKTEIDALSSLFSGVSNETLSTANKALGAAGGGPLDVSSSQQALLATDVSDGGTGLSNGVSFEGAGEAGVLEVYVIRQGDTLQGLAERALGDADRWVDIADVNGMGGLNDAGGLGTLIPGTRILLPTNRGARGGAGVLGAVTAEDLLGIDLRVDLRTGDLLLVGGNTLRTLRGPENLEQALAIRLLTEKAALPLFPEYGLPLRPGVGMTSRTATYCGVHCQDQVLSDPRVLEVRDLVVEDGGDSVDVLMNIVPIHGGVLEVIAPMKPRG